MTVPFAHPNLLTSPVLAAAVHRNLGYVDHAAKPKGVSALMKCSPCPDSREFPAMDIPHAHEPWAAVAAVATVSVTPAVASEELVRLPAVACGLQLPVHALARAMSDAYEHLPMVELLATAVAVTTALSARAKAG